MYPWNARLQIYIMITGNNFDYKETLIYRFEEGKNLKIDLQKDKPFLYFYYNSFTCLLFYAHFVELRLSYD